MATLRCSIDPQATIARAFGRGPALLEAVRDGDPRLVISLTRGDAVVLGARQRAGRVLDLEALARAGVPVLRRSTTGTAACLRAEALVWTLCLPRVDALMGDATLATLLNRNVRLLLPGLTRAGATAAYFGREWIAVRHRPGPLLGYDVTADGRVLLEAIVGWTNDLAIPLPWAAPHEQATDRWGGKPPVALGVCLGNAWSPARLAEALLAAAAERAGVGLGGEAATAAGDAPIVRTPNDPLPAGWREGPPVRVPIGYVEAAAGPDGRRWLGGDLLSAGPTLDGVARGEPLAGPLEGARADDLAAALAALDAGP
jgi:hypothetical protein